MNDLDVAWFRELNDLVGRWGWVDALVRFASNDYAIPVAVALVLGWLWFAGRNEAETERFQVAVLRVLLTMAWITVFVQVINAVIPRLRPFDALEEVHLLFYRPRDPSFPAHPVAIVVGTGVALVQAHRRWATTIAISGVVLGVARIIAGVWFPTDVLGGVAIGFAGAYFGALLLGHLEGAVTWIRSTAARMGFG